MLPERKNIIPRINIGRAFKVTIVALDPWRRKGKSDAQSYRGYGLRVNLEPDGPGSGFWWAFKIPTVIERDEVICGILLRRHEISV